MKKVYLFLCILSLLLAGCSNDNDQAATINSAYLRGTWKEVAPQENFHVLKFDESTAVLTFPTDGSFETYDYTVTDGQLYLKLPDATYIPTPVEIEYVNASTFKITTLYPHTTDTNYSLITSTFVKQ
jgi:hypothetical protein